MIYPVLQFAFHRSICKTEQYYENTLYLTNLFSATTSLANLIRQLASILTNFLLLLVLTYWQEKLYTNY